MQPFSDAETRLLWQGPAGDVEMIITQGQQPVTVILCHPHPLFGGTMGNKVVTTMARTFHEHDLSTVRFNFRGVGKSAGVHDEGSGETTDVLAIAAWVKQQRPQDKLWLAGFSFGGFVAAKAAIQLETSQLVTIAPQVSRFIMTALPALECPWLVIQGDQDEVVAPKEVYNWFENQQPSAHVVRIPAAGHFFHGQLSELRRVLEENLFK